MKMINDSYILTYSKIKDSDTFKIIHHHSHCHYSTAQPLNPRDPKQNAL